MKSRKNKTLINSKSYFSSWEEHCFLQGANEILMSEKKDPEFICGSPSSPAKKELMLQLGINFIVEEIILILLWMWSTAAPFLKGSSLQAVPGVGQAW